MAAPQQSPWPLYDLFLDVPHPAASPNHSPLIVVGAPPPLEHGGGNQDSIEQELQKSVPQIARFAFPEYDQDASPPAPPGGGQAAAAAAAPPPVNRFDQYAMQPPAFQNYTFSLTLQSGMRVYGHVRRCLPCHVGAKTRYDVARRGERALVILTRVTGADVIYAAVLKTIDAIASHAAAMPQTATQEQPQKAFLHDMFYRHQKIARMHASKPPTAPVFLTIPNLEVGKDGAQEFSLVDCTNFHLPTPLLVRTSMGDLVSNTSNTSILPVLRCLGVAHTLRLLCALLSERRVILISASPTRLATCCKSAIATLAQGLLSWHHLYIPVLPPHLWEYLAAPYPYLIGMLASLTPRLDRTDGLGEVILINLDQNSMETRNIPTHEIQDRIPDLLRNVNSDPYSLQQLGGSGAVPLSAPEMLASDLVDLLKNDKKVLHGESTLASMQDTAVKATKAVKATFSKLKAKGKKLMAQKASSFNENDPKEAEQEPAEPPEVNPMSPDFIYTEGCRNEIGEGEARLAFSSFFVTMIGNMKWYLSAQPGQEPQLDRQRFLQQKRAAGDGESSTMWPLLQNFCQTQMLEEFAKYRIAEMKNRQPVTSASPLFLQCSNYHHQHKVEFNLLNIRRVSRQVSQTNPSTMLQETNARRMAMELTSKRAFEGDYNKSLADLVESCRETSSVLFDVMSVVWIRMRDNRGLQWRHATHSLHILKNLLFHGPLAAVAEATDGLDKIRALKYYNGNRQTSICVQIRTAATQVYSLIVDRSKLYHIRRVCINKRRSLRKKYQQPIEKDWRLEKVASVTFQKIHAAMHPNAPRTARASVSAQPAYNPTPTYAVLPPAPAQQVVRSAPASSQQQSGDLLDLQQAPASSPNTDVLGVLGGNPAPPSAGSDMLGIFGVMSLSSSGQPQQPTGRQLPTQQYAVSQQPPQGQYQQPQQHRSHSNSPTPPQQHTRAQNHSPTPPQYSQHQANPFAPQQQQPVGQYALQQPPQQPVHQYTGGAHSTQRPQYVQPQPTNAGYGQPGQPNAYPATTGYQAQPGAAPAIAQPPSGAVGYAHQVPPQAHPQQGFHSAQTPPNSYGYQQQQQPQPGAPSYPGGPAQQRPPQQGPFF